MSRERGAPRANGPLKFRFAYATGPPASKKGGALDCNPHESSNRQRRTHQKVRTGCQTCKSRRKKCDETKPACQRCTSTGRLCQGYLDRPFMKEISSDDSSPSTWNSQDGSPRSISTPSTGTAATSIIFQQQDHLVRSPNSYAAVGHLSDVDRQSFAYFIFCTFPQFSSYFDSPIMRSRMMLAFDNPALFSAAVALAAVHRRFNCGISREAFELCAHADRLHKKATCELAIWKQQNSGNPSSHYHSTTMMTEMLLSLFESFQDHREASVQHTKSSINHLIQTCLFKPIRKERRFCPNICKSRVFAKLLYQLYCQMTKLFDTPIKILSCDARGETLPPIPNVFVSLEQARDFLFTEIDWIILSTARWHDIDDRHAAQKMHATRFIEWGHAYDRLIQSIDQSRTSQETSACAFMKLGRNAIYLLTYFVFFVDLTVQQPLGLPTFGPDPSVDTTEPEVSEMVISLSQASRDDHILDQNLGRVRDLLEPLVDDPTIWGTLSTVHDGYMTDADHQLPDLCSYTSCKAPQIGVYSVANRVSADGETAMAVALQGKLPMFRRDSWTDVSYITEYQFLLIRYYEPCEDGIGYWFTQEWWKL